MFRSLARGVVVVVALVLAAGSAVAQTTTSYPVTATCSGGGQVCNNLATVTVSTAGTLQAEFAAGAFACSSVTMTFLVDGATVATSGPVGPGGNSGFFNLGPVSAGSHTIGLRATGIPGGCNAGTLVSWGGTLLVQTSALSAASIPTLSTWGIATLLGALMLAAGWRLRARRG